MKIEMAGARFAIGAKAVRRGGGWGVDVRVVATSINEQGHQVLAPKHGALSFAGTVERAGQKERFNDQREGDATEGIEPHKKLVIDRVWPSGLKVKPLAAGETLDLQVGLWGFGDDAASTRPVNEFFEVKLVAHKHGKPAPKVTPPASAE
jgi:hypothetical protein